MVGKRIFIIYNFLLFFYKCSKILKATIHHRIVCERVVGYQVLKNLGLYTKIRIKQKNIIQNSMIKIFINLNLILESIFSSFRFCLKETERKKKYTLNIHFIWKMSFPLYISCACGGFHSFHFPELLLFFIVLNKIVFLYTFLGYNTQINIHRVTYKVCRRQVLGLSIHTRKQRIQINYMKTWNAHRGYRYRVLCKSSGMFKKKEEEFFALYKFFFFFTVVVLGVSTI